MPQEPPPIILELVEHFERNIESYQSPAYNEAPLRQAPDDKTKLQRQIDATDHEIDRLVFDLYGLTGEEIGIVEGKAS